MDPRTEIASKMQTTKKCKKCKSLNYDYTFCHKCGTQLLVPNLSIRYKRGNQTFSAKSLGRIQRAAAGMESDLIQPTQEYDRVHKEFKTNPDFVKHYGDPFKEENKARNLKKKLKVKKKI